MDTTNLSIGSRGSDVKRLQKALIAVGYDVGTTGADGVFGKNTMAAVKKYQKDKGLAVDGIAGKNTLGSLYGTSTDNAASKAPSASTKPSAPSSSAPSSSGSSKTPTGENAVNFTYDDFNYGDFSYNNYAESDEVKQAQALLQQQMANKPGQYQSRWESQINDYLNQIQNRDPFSYDFNSDAMYQQYKDNYIQQGQMAMMDTMGQAAAMTGGYGNSYAQTFGQQSYNQQLSQLNNVIPELYQMAYNRYADEGQRLQDQYGMLLNRESIDYGKYMDALNAWNSEMDYLANRYDAERNSDYSRWEADRAMAYDQYTSNRNLAYDKWQSNRDLAYNEYAAALDRAYQRERDAVEDAQWQASFDKSNSQWKAEFDEDKRRYEQNRKDSLGASSSGGSIGSGSGTGYKDLDVGSTEYNTIMKGISRATTLDELNAITSQYLALGYNPDQIKALMASKIKELTDDEDEIIDTEIPATKKNNYTIKTSVSKGSGRPAPSSKFAVRAELY